MRTSFARACLTPFPILAVLLLAGSACSSSGSSGTPSDGGVVGSQCKVTWSGAATGSVACRLTGVCGKYNFFIAAESTTSPVTAIQLTYDASTAITAGTLQAATNEITSTTVQTADPAVSYGPELDPTTGALTGGTGMTLKLTSVQYTKDPNDTCGGSAHGTLDATLLERNSAGVFGTKLLTVHAVF